jgi:hypothetical protein
MATNAYLEDFRRLARAAARGVAQALRDAPTDSTTARLALERVGDLMRCDGGVPSALATWTAHASEDLLDGAVREAEVEAREWPLPEEWTALGTADEEADHGSLAYVLQRRDETESLCVGVLRAMLTRGRSPVALGAWQPLKATLRDVDSRLEAVVSRRLAEHLLGARVCLGSVGDWVSRLADEDGGTVEASPGLGLLQLPTDVGEPSDSVVVDYLRHGRLYRYVETYAAENPAFAEELAGAFDTLLEEGELGQALIPRRWRKNHAGGAGRAVDYDLGPLRLAAAQDDTVASATIELGALPGLAADVDASLQLSAGVWTLHLVVGDDGRSAALKAVQLNGVLRTEPESDGDWRVQAPHSGEVELRVEDTTGAVFKERIRVDSSGS